MADDVDSAAISARLGITQYVVEVIANDVDPRDGPSRPPRHDHRRVPSTKPVIDVSTIRMIQRMLAAGILKHSEIAREAGVSANTVSDVATGKRKAVTTKRLQTDEGEQFLPEPIRCGDCRSADLGRALPGVHRHPRENFCLTTGRLFCVLCETSTLTHGGNTMPDLISLLSAEISALLSTPDKREHLITRAEKLFDQVVEPIDMPGPDQIIDPLLRAAVRPLVGRLYDELVKRLEVPAHAA